MIDNAYIPEEKADEDLLELAEHRPVKCSGVQWQLFEVKAMLRKVYERVNWREKPWYAKAFYIPVGALFTLCLRVSIPPVNAEHWDRRFATASPLFAFLLLVVTTRLYSNWIAVLVGTVISIVLSVAIYCNTHRNIPPSVMLLYSCSGFVVSLIWLYMFSNILIDYIRFVILITGIDNSYVGLTFLALGGSLGGRLVAHIDLAAMVSVASMGFTEMAMVGVLSGSVFLVLVGLPSAVIPYVALKG